MPNNIGGDQNDPDYNPDAPDTDPDDEPREQLERELGLVGHPKASALWSKAWNLGHANGMSEVEHYYRDLADLLTPVPSPAAPVELTEQQHVQVLMSKHHYMFSGHGTGTGSTMIYQHSVKATRRGNVTKTKLLPGQKLIVIAPDKSWLVRETKRQMKAKEKEAAKIKAARARRVPKRK